MRIRTILFFCILLFLSVSCQTGWHGEERDFRQDMRNFVQDISEYARIKDADFIIIPQNGHELLTVTGNVGGSLASDYIAAINGVGREDLFYGYESDDVATPAEETEAMLAFMGLAEDYGVEVLAIDYCFTRDYVDNSYDWNDEHGFISFAADSRNLDTIPGYPALPEGVHTGDVVTLGNTENFLYIINPSDFGTKTAFLAAVGATDYDLVIMDLFDDDGNALTAEDLDSLRTKGGGGERLLICYMSIGEAEDYRYYWQDSWDRDPPSWLVEENPFWEGNYKVEYWDEAWQSVIYGGSSGYLDRIIAAGFDGVYLDIIDAYEYFEEALGL